MNSKKECKVLNNRVTIEFLKFADIPDPDYFIKFQMANQLLRELSKEDLEKVFKFEVLDFRNFDFNNAIENNLKDKMRGLRDKEEIEYSAEIKL